MQYSKFKKLIREMYYCPEFLMVELGFMRFLLIFLGIAVVLFFMYAFLFDWIGINIAFSLPFVIIHQYCFVYFALYKQLQKQKRK